MVTLCAYHGSRGHDLRIHRCVCLALPSEKFRESIPLILLLGVITEWIIAAVMGLVDQNLTHKIMWAKIEYIGVVSVPLALLGYVLQHSGSNQKLNIKRLVWLAVIPVATLVLAWTNGYHGLIWNKYIPYQENGLVLSDKTYGPGFWVYWVYSYLVLLAATVSTFRITMVQAKIFRWQSILVLFRDSGALGWQSPLRVASQSIQEFGSYPSRFQYYWDITVNWDVPMAIIRYQANCSGSRTQGHGRWFDDP